ncbi:hypothetical protein BGZ70_009100 [Mortierella alpina]|uniref:Uncharacterized protein n=1 Tax=Mortierella alpina TaxID=64518 RepID=A0A9P6M6I4_MORAP|nr:hypothetical protein BGZ70_009100 [Mortierella alpina]
MLLSVPSLRFVVAATVTLLLLGCGLPIPVRAQSSTSSNTTTTASSGRQVQFPSNVSACVACKPAFASAACQTILDSIAKSSSTPISNNTLASCQCTGPFLSLYPDCLQCFKETNQLSMVFGGNKAPALVNLEAYCKALPSDHDEPGTTSSANPSLAMSLQRGLNEGQRVVMTVAVAAACVFMCTVP